MATKLPSGRFRAQVLIGTDTNGKRQYASFTADTEDEAEYQSLAYKLGHSKKKGGVMTLRTACEKYIATKSGVLSPSTIEGYNRIIRLYIPEELHKKRITDIKKSDIRALSDYLRVSKSVKTVHNVCGFVMSVLNANDIEINFKLPKLKKIKYHTPDPETLRRTFVALEKQNNPQLEIAVMLAAWLSLRASEIQGLQWGDIDERNRTLTVQRATITLPGQRITKCTKTDESERILPLNQYLIDKLLSIKPQHALATDNIITITHSTVYKKYCRLLCENNIPHSSFHELRHASASIMEMLGVPVMYQMARGGWSQPDILRGRYQQTFSVAELEQAKRIDEFFMRDIIGK